MSAVKFVEPLKGVLIGYQHVDPDPVNRRAVLFVHGFLGNESTTWESGANSPSFLELMAHDPDLADHDVYALKYRTRIFSGDSVKVVAQQLHNAIESKLKQYRLVLVAHSLGGLVCMHYILHNLLRNHQPPVVGLLLYGSPTTGTQLVDLANLLSIPLGFHWIGKGIGFIFKRHKQLQALGIASEEVDWLRDNWAARVVNGGHESLPSAGRMWLPVRVVTGTVDWVVPEHSAKSFYGEIDWHPLALNHRQLVKPSDRNDPHYDVARQFLQQCRAAPEPEVINELREICGTIWKGRQEKIIRNWEYEVEIHSDTGSPLSAVLKDVGFSRCKARSSYTTILQGRQLHVGVAYGEIAGRQMWRRQPAYVHMMGDEKDPGGHLQAAIDRLLNETDRPTAWKMLFPGITVTLKAPATGQEMPLTATGLEVIATGLLGSYPIPQEAWKLLGEEVTIIVEYESVVSRGLPVFYTIFPWITLGCSVHVSILGKLQYLHYYPRVFGTDNLDVQVVGPTMYKGEALITSSGLVLPGSIVELRWEYVK
jgi:pimeloyl-ACP methyl ester carboxylesterase